LLEEGVYEAAYPLHDQLVSNQDADEPSTWNDRMVDLLRKNKTIILLNCFRNYIIVGRDLEIYFVFNRFMQFEIIMVNV
jgi:hypothetical protein